MNTIAYVKNIGALITARLASGFTSVTAGGSGDATLVNGTAFDRSIINMPRSALAVIEFADTLAASKKLNLTSFTVDHSDDGSTNWTTFADSGAASGTPLSISTDAGSGGSYKGQATLAVDLTMAKKWVRVSFTPDLTATATDTATVAAMLVFGGETPIPAAA